jgi:ribosomal protein L11 methylase PrmA
MKRAAAIAAVAAFAFAVPGFTQESSAPLRGPDVHYIPTAQVIVEAMLNLAKIGKNDVVYDLGCGDGRIVIDAAKRYGVRAVGIDIDPRRIAEARENAKKAGVEKLVEFRQGDLFESDLHEATVVTLYLLPTLNVKLMPKLRKELPKGARIVSHDFDMGDWKPDQTVHVNRKNVYLWRVK